MSFSAAMIVAGKKVIGDLLTDPEKLLRNIILLIFIPLFAISVVFAIPTILTTSIPVIMMDSGKNELTQEQITYIALYDKAVIKLGEDNKKWVAQKEKDFAACDTIEVTYDFSLTWQQLFASDTVFRNQDFKGLKLKSIIEMGERLTVKEAYKEVYYVTVTDEDGSTHSVRRIRGVIKCYNPKPFEEMLDLIDFDGFDKAVAQNILNTLMRFDSDGNVTDSGDLQEYPPGSASIPYYNQCDLRWGNKRYGDDSIKSAGCGPTALAMVVSGLTNKIIYPDEMSKWAYEHNYKVRGGGSYWSLMTEGASKFGLKVQTVSRKDPNAVAKALSDGKTIIVSMGRGHFTSGGHFIVLRGITEDGKILVNDSYSYKNTQIEWDLSIIMNESSTNGGVNGRPFFVYSK